MTITATDLADRIVATAQQFDGACACAKHRQSIYDAVSMYFDPVPYHRDPDGAVHGVSTCYIFALNVLRLAGVATHNWHMGEGIGTIGIWARRVGCWQAPGDGLCPSAGDVMLIGKDGGTHVCVVVSCDGATIDTIDGGQVCRRTGGHDGIGRQMIAARSRIWWGDRAGADLVVGWVVCGLCPLV